MTRQTLVAKARDFAWLIGILAGFAGATGAQWVTGGTRLTAVEQRVTVLEGDRDDTRPILAALALDLCLRTTEPQIRVPLKCAAREAGR